MKIHSISLLLTAGLALSLFPGLSTAVQPVSILSTVNPTNDAGAVGSYSPLLSADGRYVVFLSHAKNLTTNSSLTPYLDVFLHDLATGRTVLVSAGNSGVGSGNDDSAYAVISSDGRFVAFASGADNLVPDDTNGTSDVFIRDLQQGVTSAASVGLEGQPAAPKFFVGASGFLRPNFHLSRNPVISRDGHWLAFESAATNLVAVTDANGTNDVFIRDVQSGTTRLLSVNTSGDSTGSATSELPFLSWDARRVAFVSYATNLVPEITNSRGDVYVRDLDANTTICASKDVGPYFTNGVYRCFAPVISGNGEAVAFKAADSNASYGLLFRFDVMANTLTVVNSNSPIASGPSMSDDGHLLAYDDGANAYVWEKQVGSNRLVSARFDGAATGNGPSLSPVISANGRTVAFVSAATDLMSDHAADTNAVFQLFAGDLSTGVIKLLTSDSNGQPARVNHLLANISVSADGLWVAFDSRSDDLVPGDANRESDVFVTDLAKDRIRLVSRRAESRPSVTAARHVRIAPDCLSTNGRYLLFTSLPKTSLPEDAVCCENLFIRDLLTGAEEQITDFDAVEPKEFLLSADGRRVAYITRRFVSPRYENVILLNRDTGAQVLANIDPSTGALLEDVFRRLALSPSGTRVAYQAGTGRSLFIFDSATGTNRQVTSFAGEYTSRFSPDDTKLVFRDLIFGGLSIYDLLTNGLSFIRSTPPGFAIPSSFSADSRYVAAGTSRLDIFDLQTMTQRTADTNRVGDPQLSADGVWVAYADSPVLEGAFGVKVRNLQNGTVKSATRSLSGADRGNGTSKSVGLSFDGRFVVFSSRASDLVPGDTNNLPDVFAYDVITGTTFLLSVNRRATSPGNAASSIPILGADGRTVIFQSFADDLVDGDYNFARDIFIARLGGIDSDGDGMDDDWEMAYFESLSRNGSGDLDGDGTTDRQEFLAGTDPTNLGSVLRVITVASMSGGQCTVLWASSPGRSYRVQFKDDIDAATWTYLPGTVTATGSTASMVDTSASLAHRYYRVMLP